MADQQALASDSKDTTSLSSDGTSTQQLPSESIPSSSSEHPVPQIQVVVSEEKIVVVQKNEVADKQPVLTELKDATQDSAQTSISDTTVPQNTSATVVVSETPVTQHTPIKTPSSAPITPRHPQNAAFGSSPIARLLHFSVAKTEPVFSNFVVAGISETFLSNPLEEGKRYQPQALFCFPDVQEAQAVLPPKVAADVQPSLLTFVKLLDFCFPDGVVVSRIPSSKVSDIYKAPDFFVFMLAAVCALVNHIIVPKSGASAEKSVLVAPRCYCILSQCPLEVSQLSILAGQALSKEPETQNLTFEERYKEPIGLISFFYRAIPPPVFGETLQLPGDKPENKRKFFCPPGEPEESSAQILAEWGIISLFQSLPLDNLLRLYSALLSERSVIFECANLGLLTSCAMATIPLIRPFTWQGVFVPLLPLHMQDCLDAPVPYLIGTPTISKDRIKTLDCVCVDIATGKIANYGESLPALPEGVKFMDRLRPLYRAINNTGRLQQGERPTPNQLALIPKLRDAINGWISWLVAQVADTFSGQPDESPEELCNAMLRKARKENQVFIKAFLQSQLFSVYLQQYLQPQKLARKPRPSH